MLGAYLTNVPRRIRLFGLLFFVTLLAYLLWVYLGAQRVVIPREFLEAKGRGAVVAEEIVRLSGETARQLDEINKLDQEGKYADAFNLVAEEQKRSREMREYAALLSRELSTMTSAVAQISGTDARSTALQAVNYEVTLMGKLVMGKLVTYSEYLAQLLEALRRKFEGLAPGAPSVDELIGNINKEVAAINDLNSKFLSEIAKLERATE
ncbi:MAG: hypothetical protein HYT14_01915 [Candidatus Liptonbacteria bacterium]|nr:hypothetical protein [Candidatus Liptonbacteria bacterium]